MNGWQIMAVACWLGMCGAAIDNPALSGAHGVAFMGLGAGTLICMILGGGLRGAGSASRISTRDSHDTSHSYNTSNSHNTAINYTITNHHHHAAPSQDIAALMREVEAMRLEMRAQARLTAVGAEGRDRIEHAQGRAPLDQPLLAAQYRGHLRAAPPPMEIEAPKKSLVLAMLRHLAARRTD